MKKLLLSLAVSGVLIGTIRAAGTAGGGAHSFIGIGNGNSTSGAYSGTVGGNSLTVDGSESFIGSGQNNKIESTATHSVISGGAENNIKATHANISGGYNNIINSGGTYSSILGGTRLTISGKGSLGYRGYVSGSPANEIITSDNVASFMDVDFGIGVLNPTSKLHVDGGTDTWIKVTGDNGAGTNQTHALLGRADNDSGYFALYKENNQKIRLDARYENNAAYKPSFIDTGSNFGIGTKTPQSALQVDGYIQMDTTAGTPPSGDCNATAERGRMKVDPSTSLMWVCMNSGWVSK